MLPEVSTGPKPPVAWRRILADVLIISLLWAYLVALSLLRVLIPGTNETHYLTKARHFWDPAWCAGDLFLESSNPHLLFYITFGGLTQILPLTQAAVVGRVLGLLVVAVGWFRLGWALTGFRAGPVLALPLFALLHTLGNWSGEWLIGGIESKVPAYGCLFWGLGCWLEGRWLGAALGLGLATGFHPIIGPWGIVALMFAELAGRLCRSKLSVNTLYSVPWQRVLLAAVLGLGCALPGLVPAVATITGSTPQESLDATYLQFAGRLVHHLDPVRFPLTAHRYFGMQLLVWCLLLTLLSPTLATRRWRRFVWGGLAIAGVGVLLAMGPRPVKLMPGWEWRIGLLKFYPFRLADLILPAAVSLAAVAAGKQYWGATRLRQGQAVCAVVCSGILAVILPGTDRVPSRMSPERLEHWIAALIWVRDETEPDELLYCYDEHYAVRWYAERPEYVDYKDCPQDARGLLEWNRRQWRIADWNRRSYVNSDAVLQRSELAELHELTGIDTLVLPRRIRVAVTPDHVNPEFAVYRLRPG